MNTPIVAIVGRPNVGKSTLFNRLAGKKVAVIAEESGTTRDRITTPITIENKRFLLTDTGGIGISANSDVLQSEIQSQAEFAIDIASVILFVTDVNEGPTPIDKDLTNVLRKTKTPIILITNKADTPKSELLSNEFYSLGIGSPISISAYHNHGINDLKQSIAKLVPRNETNNDLDQSSISLSIIGRPNVGKSTLVNTITQESRSIVSPIPGTTRDAIDTLFEYKNTSINLIDTAGIRRRGKVEPGIEQFSVIRSEQAIERSNIVCILLDAEEPITAQDTHVAGLAIESFKGVIIAVNKSELLSDEEKDELSYAVNTHFGFAPYAPIFFISAKENTGIDDILDTVLIIHEERMRRIEPSMLSNLIWDIVGSHQIPHKGKRSLVIRSVIQDNINPPTFKFKVNDTNLIHFSYKRYIENQMRKELDFQWTHLNLIFY